MNQRKQVVSMFVKYPEAGKVKTRLAKTVGFDEAAKIYDKLAQINFSVLKELKDECAQVGIFYDPPDRRVDIQNWLKGASFYQSQEGIELGERLKRAFSQLFEKGFEKALIVGSDTLRLKSHLIQKAWDVLDAKDAVFGPAKDGGYYLVGMKMLYGDIFEGISWSTSEVLNETLEKVEALNLSFELIDVLEDLDEIKKEEIVHE